MSEHSELWTCPQCGSRQDIARLGFYTEIQCAQCGCSAHVHTMLANYKVESILGIGGMSVVFQARDLVLGRPLAIKVLNETYRDTPERIAGIGNECSLMAKVRHDNVVAVYSAGWARGQFFIAMELVDGRNLELIVDEQGGLKPIEAIEIIRQVAEGLKAAHEAGILHRDVKPGNVLISADGRAKVLDFGLSLDEKSGVDESDIIWATPYYVPPETLRREEENVQSDIYALGMTLRNLLTGKAKLVGDPQTVPDMLVAKKTMPMLKQECPDLDAEICLLVDRMTAFDAADRPADYEAVLAQIAVVQNGLMEATDPAARARRKKEKLITMAGAAGCAVLGVLGGLAVSFSTPSSRIQETISVGELQWAERDAYQEAETLLKSGDLKKASEVFGGLTGETSESTASAVAILLRTAVDVLEGKSTANGYNRFAEVESRRNTAAPAGGESFDRMTALVAAIKQMSANASDAAHAFGNPLLKAAAQILIADSYVHSGDESKAEELIVQAIASLQAGEAAGMVGHVEEYRRAVPRRAARIRFERLKDLFRTGNYESAVKSVAAMPAQKLGKTERETLLVMSEAAAIMQAIHESLKKHNRSVQPGMSPVDLRTAAAGLGATEKVPREFYCVALILSGDMEAAFRENPHAADADSQEPFAVLMRDWKTRLGM